MPFLKSIKECSGSFYHPHNKTIFRIGFGKITLRKITLRNILGFRNKGKKAVVGIGVLIIFIAAILVASISAGVLLRTQTVLQSQALKTGAEAREAISTNLALQSIMGSDGRNGRIEEMESMLKLGASSRPVNLDKTLIIIGTANDSITLKYGGIGEDIHFTNVPSRRIVEGIGKEPRRLRLDLDLDYVEDYVYLIDDSTIYFNLSSDPSFNISIMDILVPGVTFSDTYPLIGRRNYGSMSIAGTTTEVGVLDSGMKIFVNVVPEHVGYGIYAIKYLTKGKQHKEHAFVYGDIIRVYTEFSYPVLEGSDISVSYNTQDGVALTRSVSTPNSMTSQKVRIFP